MNREHDQSTRKAMRAGISGENVLRPLDEFSVTEVQHIGNCHAVMAKIKNWSDCSGLYPNKQ